VTPHHSPPSAAPRWPILAALAAAVLGLHLVLLAGGVPLTSLPATQPASAAATEMATATTDPATARSLAQAASPVRVSTVRWVVPAPVPTPIAAAPPPPRPRPVARAVPAPREAVVAEVPAVPEPATEQLAPAPEVAEAASPAPDEPKGPHPDVVAAAEPAPAATTEPDPAPAPDAIAEAAEFAAPDDLLLAAATPGQARKSAAAVKLPPAQPPASTRLNYDVSGRVKGIAYQARGTLDWTLADARYSARMEMRVFLLGSRVQTSTGRVGPAGLMPERFADKSRSEKAAHFEADRQRIRFSTNAPEVPLLPGAQDRLSLFLQLAGLLQARPQAYATGQTVDMQVAGTGDAPVWRFQVGEESTLSLPAGEFRVRHLVRQPRKEFDSTVEMWLAPSLQHLPVRLRVTQPNGDVADQQLSQMP
jgi:hypothetical protein